MIWRHLAYGHPFLENMEDGAEPLGDDSDLETEIKLDPASSSEELAKAKEIAEIEESSYGGGRGEHNETEKVQNAGSKYPVREEGPREHRKGDLKGDKKQDSSDAAAASSANEKDEVFASFSSSLSEVLEDKTPGSSSETNSSSESDHNEQSKYRSSQILTLLDEMTDFIATHGNGGKIDWNAMVKNTSTGISNAREYQMIWRHLVNGTPLPENIEDGAEPLDDDSDLETEPDFEAFERAEESLKIFFNSSPATSITEIKTMFEIDQMEKKATEEDHDNMTDTGSRSLVNEKSLVVASLANEGPGEHCKGDLKGVENKAASSAAAAAASLANDRDEIVDSSSLSEDGEDKVPAGSSSETIVIDTAAGSETDPIEETKEEEKEPLT